MPRRAFTTGFVVVVLASLVSLTARAASVAADLNTWLVSNQPHSGSATASNGVWVVSPGGTMVGQMVNGRPTFFASPDAANGYRITARVATDATDNDFFGFALGFSTDPSDPAADYLLVDWKQANQTVNWGDGAGPVSGSVGLAVSRVTGVPVLGELWSHTNSAANPLGGVTELARGTTLGSSGWTGSTAHDFVIEYTTTSLDVRVDGSPEVSITGDFPAGPFALYDFSQPGIGFSDISFESLNEPPTVDGLGADDVVVPEGQAGRSSGSFTDPNGDDLTLTCTGDCAGFSDDGGGAWSWSQILPEGPRSDNIAVTASDGELEVSDTFDITVLNLAPVITSTSALPTSVPDDSDLVVSAEFTDAGILDTHTATFQWGDDASSAGSIIESDGSGTTTASHRYAEPGLYTVTVTVWDDDGDSDTATLGQIFVFDPDDFVTGGGWVSSPQGAVIDDPDHEARATFGFVARYRRDGSVRGNLEVQAHGALRFHATSFDTLHIANGVASFSGEGELDGEVGYSFQVVATDERLAPGTEDLLWVEITGPESLVYGGSAYPSGLPIIGKGIQVHDKS